MTTAPPSDSTAFDLRGGAYDFTVEIAAPPAVVWVALTAEIDRWWLPDFHMLGADSTVSLTAEAGGHLREDGPNGSLLWYTVQMAVTGESLHLVGYSTPQWGGPTTSMLSLELSPAAGSDGLGCVLTVADALVGRLPDGHLDELRAGWQQLFGDGLRPHAEALGG